MTRFQRLKRFASRHHYLFIICGACLGAALGVALARLVMPE